MTTVRERLTVGVVVITDGNRPDELIAMTQSLDGQPLDERILVANGCTLPRFDTWTTVTSPTNLGVPGGRSLGVTASTCDLLIFLDDDSTARSDDLVNRTREIFETHVDLGALAYRVVVTGTNRSLQRWVPAHRPAASDCSLADAATFPGNGHALRVAAFEQVGGYTNEFFFKHEETELSWKLLDAGWNVAYSSSLLVEHPETTESRNPIALHNTVRNKIWLARILLPRPLSWCTVTISTCRALASKRGVGDLRALGRGATSGLLDLPRQRRPIRWRTVWQISRRGRVPLA